jgi:2',3'-cyclic-nucleotide 2'-phosphodiesterase (5'-nucleotidase family)
MRHRPYNPIRILLFIIALAFVAPARAQSTAIQPCDATPASTAKPSITPAKVGVRTTQTAVDAKIADDDAIEKLLAPYSGKVRALDVRVGTLEGNLKKERVGGGPLGNFVVDGMRAQARTKLGKPVALAIMNAGGLRKNDIAAGELRASDIFELLPFENALVAVDLTGAQLSRLLQIVVRDAQAGARIHYKWNDQSRPEFISGKLVDDNGHEQEIDSEQLYTIVTIDYLLNLRSGAYAILQEAKSTTPLNLTVRDAIMAYVKAETAAGRAIRSRLDDRYVQVGPGPKTPPEEPR